MINAIEDMLAQVSQTARDQTGRVASEVNAAYDAMNAAKTLFNQQMELAREKRAEADRITATAVRELDTALTNAGAVQIGIVQQLGNGQMVTGAMFSSGRKSLLSSGDQET